MDDASLLGLVAERERCDDAFQVLYGRYSKMVYGICARGLNRADAEDATQAVFLILAKKAETLKRSGSLSGWLYRTAQLTVLEVRRQAARRRCREHRGAQVLKPNSEENNHAAADEVAAHLDQAIASLRRKQQDVVVLHYLQGKSLRETAAELNCSEGSVKKRLEYALGKMRQFFTKRKIVMPAVALGSLIESEGAASAPAGLAQCTPSAFYSFGSAGTAQTSQTIAKGAMKAMFWIKLKFAALLVSSTIAAAGIGTLAVELQGAEPKPAKNDKRAEMKGPLASLPSQPGPQLQKIKNLGDNEWVNLGAPAPDPKWGTARGRSWTGNIPYAPDLKGAFLAGEGRHAYVKPDGHFMDDVWFYDVYAHRWICLYPGVDVNTIAKRIKDKEFVVDEHGLLLDKEGQPYPGDSIHGWGFLSYDTNLRKFAYVCAQFNCYFANSANGPLAEAAGLFGAQRQGKEKPLSPFFYDVVTGKFECHEVKGGEALPGSMRGLFCNLVYADSMKEYFYGGGDGVYYYDPAKNSWRNGNPKGPAPQGYDNGACYDAKRNRIYYGSNGIFYIYDLGTNTWSTPQPKGTDAAGIFTAAFTSFYYDSVSDKVVAFMWDEPNHASSYLFSYDPETNAWLPKRDVPQGIPHNGRIAGSGFFAADMNAFLFHTGGDSDDNGEIWAYRYKKQAEAKKSSK